MKKKVLSVLLAAVMVGSLLGAGGVKTAYADNETAATEEAEEESSAGEDDLSDTAEAETSEETGEEAVEESGDTGSGGAEEETEESSEEESEEETSEEQAEEEEESEEASEGTTEKVTSEDETVAKEASSTSVDAEEGTEGTEETTEEESEEEETDAEEASEAAEESEEEAEEASEEDTDSSSDDPEVAKTATNLEMVDDGGEYDGYYMSNVTLTIPAVEENEEYDIVFVLDKSTSPDLLEQAEDLVEDLQKEVSGSGAVVNVAVVVFNKEATTFGFYDLETQLDEIKNAINYEIASGTNTHAGLLAAQALLDGDSDVDAENKYMIFVSDGITYMYNADYTVTAWGFYSDGNGTEDGSVLAYWSGPSIWGVKFGKTSATDYSTNDSYTPDNWSSYLTSVGTQYAEQQAETHDNNTTGYEYTYGGTATNYTDPSEYKEYVNSVEIALYKTYTVYQEMVSAGYNCYSVTANTGSGSQYTWGPSFMRFLANDEGVTFEEIENEIMYFVDSGSIVVDYMGYVEDDYDFDFVDSASYLTLSVGSTVYEAVDLGDSTYGFKTVTDDDGNTSYAFKLVYEKGNGTDNEKFTLYIYEAVTYFNPVKLNYSVILTNPKTEAGTYGTYDEDGSEGYTSLYTNNSATLYPVDTDGNAGDAVPFPMPTVSYTVEAEETTKEETATTTTKSSKYYSSSGSSNTTTVSSVQTGDSSGVELWIVLAAVAAAGLAGAGVYGWRRKKRMGRG